MKKLLTILPFYVFTAAFGQSINKQSSIQTDSLIVGKVIYIKGYPIEGATNLWGPSVYSNNRTIFTGSGIDWLMSNHPFILQLRSDLDKVMAENAKLKTDMAILKAAVAAHSDAIDAHDSAIVKLQTDSTEMQITNIGTIAKPNWKIITVKPK